MPPRILYLDGLRGVLALIVFFHHYLYIYYPEFIFGGSFTEFSLRSGYNGLKWIALTPINLLFNPGFAIHFFFLLSGYVQSQNYYAGGSIAGIQRSLLKRYFRLAIPVLSVVLLVYAAHKFQLVRKDLIPTNILNADWLKSMLPNTLNFAELFKEGLISCFQRNSRYYQVLWTMPTELANSYLVLLLILAFHRLKHQSHLIIALLLIQFFVLKEYYSIAFVTGMLVAKQHQQSKTFNQFFNKGWIKLLCLLIGLYFGSYPFTGYQGAVAQSLYAPISFFETYPHIISYFIGTSFLLLFLIQDKGSQKLLSKRIFLFYGRISFMLYLIHFLILLTVTPILIEAVHNLALGLLLSTLIITGIAWLLTRLIDEPVLQLSNKWSRLFMKKES